jgi:hypothetical protein
MSDGARVKPHFGPYEPPVLRRGDWPGHGEPARACHAVLLARMADAGQS